MDNGVALKPIAHQRIVITGASSDIGLAIAEAAIAAGARVMLAARNGAALADIRDRLTAAGGDVGILAVDIARPGAAGELLDATDALWRLRHLGQQCNLRTHPETSIDDHRRVFEVGYWGLVNGTRAATAHMAIGAGLHGAWHGRAFGVAHNWRLSTRPSVRTAIASQSRISRAKQAGTRGPHRRLPPQSRP